MKQKVNEIYSEISTYFLEISVMEALRNKLKRTERVIIKSFIICTFVSLILLGWGIKTGKQFYMKGDTMAAVR